MTDIERKDAEEIRDQVLALQQTQAEEESDVQAHDMAEGGTSSASYFLCTSSPV